MLFFSPGASVRWKWWAPTGAQPWAMLFEQCSRSCTCRSGAAGPPYTPQKASRLVSKLVQRGVGPEYGVVIPALPVLCLMIDGTFHHFHLAGGKVALEIGAVVHGIPQAELHIAEHVQRAGAAVLFSSVSRSISQASPRGTKKFLSGRNADFSRPAGSCSPDRGGRCNCPVPSWRAASPGSRWCRHR